jgi:hypothetical protein
VDAVAVEVATGSVVVLGGARVGVAGKDLRVTQRDAGVQGIRDRRVPQRMGADVPRDASGYRARKDTAANWAVDMADSWNGSKIVPDMGSPDAATSHPAQTPPAANTARHPDRRRWTQPKTTRPRPQAAKWGRSADRDGTRRIDARPNSRKIRVHDPKP